MSKFSRLTREEIQSAVEPSANDRQSDAERIAKANAIIAGCCPISESVAATYLSKRGINVDGIQRGLIGWHRSSNSLVALGRNAEGEVSCVQRLFFDTAGNPILENNGKKKRRTNGVLKGAALTIDGVGDVLITEGTEDALTLWQATGQPIRCAFGKGGLGEVPLPAGAAVVVVAYNDPDMSAAFKAADHLFERGHRVSIAFPEGAKDSNELLTMAGAAAVRGLVACAKPYDPGPAFISWGAFTMDRDGLTMEVTKGKSDSAKAVDEWISAPFEVLGATRDPHGRDWGKWLRWRDGDGREHLKHIGDAALQGDPASLCGSLAADGLRINRAQQRALVSYLCGVTVKGRVTMAPRTGWHTIGGRDVFVLPGETIGARGGENVILDTVAAGPYDAHGSLEEWKEGVGSLAADHSLAVLAISVALAGPLLHLAGQEGGGLNFFGPSSKGKTTLLQLAASVWGRGASPGYVRAWRATANGLEGAAASATDTALVLDELGVIEARDAAAAIYGLANGSGKARAARDGSPKEPKSWRVLVLSSGEIPIAAKLSEDRGRKARAGQLVRMLDVPADRGRGFGAFDNGGPNSDAAALSQRFKVAAISAYGTAGPEFVRRLIAERIDGETICAMVLDFVAAVLPAGADGQIDRAAQRLGLIAVAGELATALRVTPWQAGAVRAAAAWALEQWIEGRGGTAPAEARQAIETVRLAIEQHGEARFEAIGEGDARPVNNRLGWRKGEGGEREWWIPPQVWKAEICAGLDPSFVAKVLAERGFLRTQGGPGFQCKVNLGGNQRAWAYVLTAGIMDGGGDAA